MDELDLKPCPFCGGQPYVKIGMMQLRFFKCNHCGAVVSFDSDFTNRRPDIAYKLWNRRAEDERSN